MQSNDDVLENVRDDSVSGVFEKNQQQYIEEIRTNMNKLRASGDVNAQLKGILAALNEINWETGRELENLGISLKIIHDLQEATTQPSSDMGMK